MLTTNSIMGFFFFFYNFRGSLQCRVLGACGEALEDKGHLLKSSGESSRFTAGSSSSADMECGGGELSDSGSSGYWSWDHGNTSPTPSPSVTEMDSSPDEGLYMEMEQGEELNSKKPKVY